MDTAYKQHEQPYSSSSAQLPLPYTPKLEEEGKAISEMARFERYAASERGQKTLERALDAADERARALDKQVRMTPEKARVVLKN